MDEAKRQRLEVGGFRVRTASEFLGLSQAEEALVENRRNTRQSGSDAAQVSVSPEQPGSADNS